MTESKQIIVKAILTRAKELKGSLKRLKEQIGNLSNTSDFRNIFYLKSLLEEYNDVCSQFLTTLEESSLYSLLPYVSLDFLYHKPSIESVPPSLKSYLSSLDVDVALSMLEQAERGCSIITSVCESLLKPRIPQDSLDKLSQLWDEVEKIEKELPEGKEFLITNLGDALYEYERGHFLASALIASRVITYVFEQIPAYEEDQKSSDLAKLKVEALVRMGIIDKDRKDEQESFLRASKLARNILSHRAYMFPKIEEALTSIASAITFCRYLIHSTEHSHQ
jgi:hypothetical protein